MKKRNNRINKTIIILLTIIIILSILLIFTFLYTKKCKDYECFNSAVVNCEKASYIDEDIEATWEYKILGKEDGKCLINVKLLMVKKGKADAETLVGKEMICKLTEENINSFILKNQNIKPQSDINKCTGILKEDMQAIIIKNLWGIVIKNLGSIKEEVKPI